MESIKRFRNSLFIIRKQTILNIVLRSGARSTVKLYHSWNHKAVLDIPPALTVIRFIRLEVTVCLIRRDAYVNAIISCHVSTPSAIGTKG